MAAKDETSSEVRACQQSSELRMEKCLFGKQEIELPELLMEDGLLFSEVINLENWQASLTDDQRSALVKLMPEFPENDSEEKQKTLEMLFTGKNFKFGNPLKQFHKKLKDGRFLPDIARYVALCRKAKQQEYQFQQEVYYENLLCEILMNRQRIRDELYRNPPEEPVKFDHIYWSHNPSKPKNQNLNYRVNQKCHQLIREVNQECGQAETSSDEEEDSSAASTVFLSGRNQQQQQQQLQQQRQVAPKVQIMAPDSPDFNRTSVLETFAPRSLLQAPAITSNGSPVSKKWLNCGKHPIMDVTGEDYQDMIRKHKKRKLEYPDHPELDTAGLTLDEIISRTQISKKVKTTAAVNCKKKLKKSDATKKVPVKCEVDVTASAFLATPTLNQVTVSPGVECMSQIDRLDVGDLLSIKKEESDEEVDVQDCSSFARVTGSRHNFGRYANFFSLLKELVCEDPEEKIVTSKLEEKVREWQESDSAPELNPWFKEQPSWVDLVSSSLKFLSGDILGLSLDNFIPLLDYKERAQQWRWIGQGRDSDEDLANLYTHWAENRDTEQLDSGSDRMAPVPPPRMRTDYTVRPSTEDERLQFQAQEKERFSNPHKAYTYRMHGYESVVGPVKGVYAKESAIIKAREHALLIKDRPSYVTILTLVHDGAARLPNGEGTRNDICELLKDSQFLAPGVTESQINTVVSGALDRLHYEKDPCVKYDGTRKLWIYRHRNRTEEEFEKIHQAQAAAAKAKKMALPKKSKVVKPSSAKKTKEPGTAAQRLLETLMVQSSAVDSSSSVVLSQASGAYSSTMPVASLANAQLGVNDVAAYLSSSGNIISLGGSQKGLAISMSTATAAASVPSSMSKALAGDALISMPTKTTNVDVRLHQVSSVGKPFTISLVQQQKPVATTTLPSNIQHHLLSGSKPVSFNLIQSLTGPKTATNSAPCSTSSTSSSTTPSDIVWPQSKAILFPSPSSQADSSKPKIVSLQHLAKASHLPSTASQLQHQIKALQQHPGTSAHAPIAVLQTSSRLVGAGTTTKPLMTGIIQHQQRLSNVIQMTGASVGQNILSGKSGVVGSAAGKPFTTTLSTLTELKDGLALSNSATSITSELNYKRDTKDQTNSLAPIIVGYKGSSNPSGIVVMSSTSAASTAMKSDSAFTMTSSSSPILTQQLAAQILKPIGGKPIFIGGKPATILASGKPFSIGGKHMLISRGSSGGGQVSQILEAVSGASVGTVSSGVSVLSQPTVTVANTPKSTASPSLVSQILQSGTLLSQQGLLRGGLVRVSGNGQVMISGQQPVRTGAQGQQVRVASPAGTQMRLMSIPTGALSQGTRIIVPDQSSLVMAASIPQSVPDLNAERKANVVTSFANIVGTQMFLQQPTNVALQQQASRSGNLHSTLIAQNAKSEQNIQLIKSLISPAASKQQQQTAILLTHPTSQSLSIAVEPGDKCGATMAGPSARAKAGPVFARIITPPTSIRLANVHPGQMLTPGHLSSMPSLVQVSGGQLALDPNQIQQLVAAQKPNNPDCADKINTTTSSTETESR